MTKELKESDIQAEILVTLKEITASLKKTNTLLTFIASSFGATTTENIDKLYEALEKKKEITSTEVQTLCGTSKVTALTLMRRLAKENTDFVFTERKGIQPCKLSLNPLN